jgi:hypothetical protein
MTENTMAASFRMLVDPVVQHAAANLDWLWAALIGVGGATVGGLVSGWFVVLAGRRQWQRDLEDARRDRSERAAQAIGDALASMDAAVVLWQENQKDTEPLHLAYGDCARTVRVQAMALSDQALRDRLDRHMRLTSIFADTAIRGGGAALALSETVRRHTVAVISALEAHVSAQPLPAYENLDTTDRNALVSWGAGSAGKHVSN